MPQDKRAEALRLEVGRRLRLTRKALDIDRVEMAQKLEVSRQRWFNYESGRRPFDMIVAIDLCNSEQLTLEWLFRGIKSGLPSNLRQKISKAERVAKAETGQRKLESVDN